MAGPFRRPATAAGNWSGFVDQLKLLILDEPTEGIQPSIIDQIEDAIHSLKKEGDLSIILVEQYLDFAKAASDTFYILNRGCVVHQGESEALSPEIISEHLTV